MNGWPDWRDPKDAPINEDVLIYNSGFWIARKDEQGQWRKRWGGAYNKPPDGFILLPEKP